MTLSGGCATALRGKDQGMKLETDPSGAQVLIESVGEGAPKAVTVITPAKVDLRRNLEHKLTFTKDGYHPVMVTLKGNWDGAALPGFALPGGSLSLAADRASGADLAFYPLPKIKLTPATTATTRPIELFQHRTKLLNKEQHEAELRELERDALTKEII